jgi:hypothetical protein
LLEQEQLPVTGKLREISLERALQCWSISRIAMR